MRPNMDTEHGFPAAMSEASLLTKREAGAIDMLKMFPSAFTMISILLFSVPTWIIITIGHNPAVRYFRSGWYLAVLIIPVVTAIVHFVHVRKKAPNKVAVVIGLILPNLILLWYANSLYVDALDKTDKLFSFDCNSFARKRDIQRSWEAAYELYIGCVNATSKRSGVPRERLMSTFRIQDCEEYNAALTGFTVAGTKAYEDRHYVEWTYLRHLEEEHFCSGWCYPSRQLWSSKTHKDSCSVVVSQIYLSYVRPHASQVCMLMLASLGATAMLLITLGPVLRKHGLAW